MVEAVNAADHLTGDYGAYSNSCTMPAPMGVQKKMIDLAYEHVTDTFFFIQC
jgi:hypothetical protein